MSTTSTPALFQPIKVGEIELKYRVVNTTRNAQADQGTLLITEAVFVAPQAGGYNNMAGIWSQEQIDAWKEITDSVHTAGSFIFMQLMSLGRHADPALLAAEGYPYTAASLIPLSERPTPIPREMTIVEIQEFVNLYAQAAKNAMEAGFDGVEVHGANGHLVDQFLEDTTNKRTDAQFALEIVDAIAKTVGIEKVGIRISPWSTFQGMRMVDPKPQFEYFVSTLKQAHPKLAYLHVIEPRIAGPEGDDHTLNAHSGNDSDEELSDFIREIWRPNPMISAGGYTRESALMRAEKHRDIIAFGRRFIANPDLPDRLEKDILLTKYSRDTFYVPAEVPNPAAGYVDYPFSSKEDN
ncbi:hypothetical protein BDQ17DRAFT_1429165 [Cyathus striatus]|nr:hypothetical protein BDQ17DRAFT_1429165 [Cyathus striatus]